MNGQIRETSAADSRMTPSGKICKLGNILNALHLTRANATERTIRLCDDALEAVRTLQDHIPMSKRQGGGE